jgi:hypothetical protein
MHMHICVHEPNSLDYSMTDDLMSKEQQEKIH